LEKKLQPWRNFFSSKKKRLFVDVEARQDSEHHQRGYLQGRNNIHIASRLFVLKGNERYFPSIDEAKDQMEDEYAPQSKTIHLIRRGGQRIKLGQEPDLVRKDK